MILEDSEIIIFQCKTTNVHNHNYMWKKNMIFNIWVFPKILVPQNGWFIMENPIKMG